MNRTRTYQISGEQYHHGVDPRVSELDVCLAVDGMQGATAPLPHQLPLDTGKLIHQRLKFNTYLSNISVL